MLTKDTSTCILFWAKVLPQHESTVWLLMSYFACGSMSQLLSESKCYVGKRGINFAKSPSTFACFATQWRRWSIPSVQFCLRSNDWFTPRHFWKTQCSWQISFQRRNKTWQKYKLHLPGMITTYYDTVALKSFTSGCDGWFVYGSNKTSRWRLEFTRSSWCDVLQQ